jgi:hypothetical protein
MHRVRRRCVHQEDGRLGGLDAMRTEDLPFQAFNHAVWQTNSTLPELAHHSDRGPQYLSLADTDRLADSALGGVTWR